MVVIIVVIMVVTIVIIIRFEWDQVVTWEISGRGAGHKLLSRRTSFHDDDHDDYHHDHDDDEEEVYDDDDGIRHVWNDFECFSLYRVKVALATL